MKKVFVARNPVFAHLLKGVLEAENIEAIVQGDLLWSARGGIPLADDTAPSVWVVNDADYDRALQIANEMDHGPEDPSEDGQEWRCENCRETNDSPFTECWNCGKERPL